MRHKAILTFLASAILIITIPFLAHANEKLVFSSIKSTLSDICFRVLEEAYGRINIEIELKPYPVLRSLHSSSTGLVDGELFKIKGLEEKHPNLIMIPVPINTVESMILSKKRPEPFTGWQSLAPLKIGIYRGVLFTKKKTAKAGCTKVFEIETHDQIYRMLELDRIDIAILTRISSLKLLRKFGPTDIKLIEPPLETFPVYHYLNKKHSNLVPKITAALKEMQKEGRIQQIRNEVIQKEFGELLRPNN
ncbi:substrate-binding periplasmic protein [Maridesulfovibrio frigidus]|uniref:substrate-binding periplasmic protein n=1 Tax=Maridesulfovibrio frigidus TaxID=340956 RepID=UPI0004E226E5|nr:transporter substrate-binding domain-containing protein [Maridesulfovibrio frigidus]